MDQQLRELRRQLDVSPGDAGLRARYVQRLARVHRGAALALLRDREAWQRADPVLQDAAILLIDRGLGERWEWRETCRHTCGGQEHRIGCFLHRPTGVLFHLLPGGRYVRGTVDPEAEAEWCRPVEEAHLPGEFSQRALRDETPAHEIVVLPFLLSRAPLTREEWDRSPPRPDLAPVDSWFGGARFEGAQLPLHFAEPLVIDSWLLENRDALRLPSEAEWEYACRAGTRSRFYWGDEMDPAHCWCEENSGERLHPVTRHADHVNAFGLVDVLGNVWEVCRDSYDDRARSDPEGAPAEGYVDGPYDPHPRFQEEERGRLLRGGSAFSPAAWCRSAARRRLSGSQIEIVGARIARSLPALDALVLAPPPPRVFAGRVVELVYGDLALSATEAVANAANDQLAMGGGVAGALRAEGGLEIEREAIRSAPAPLGSVVRTGGGTLMADLVYHAVVIRYDLRGGTSPADVRVAIRGLLAAAGEDGISSLALPLFGAGVGGLSLPRAVETVLEALEEHASLAPAGLRIEVRVIDAAEYEEAREAWQRFQDREHRQARVDRAAEDYIQRLLDERSGEE